MKEFKAAISSGLDILEVPFKKLSEPLTFPSFEEGHPTPWHSPHSHDFSMMMMSCFLLTWKGFLTWRRDSILRVTYLLKNSENS